MVNISPWAMLMTPMHAEGDGQPQGGEQEHAGQRQAVQQAAADGDHQRSRPFDRATARAAAASRTRASVSTELPSGPWRQPLQLGEKCVAGGLARRWPALPAARRGVGAGESRRGPAPGQRVRDARVLLARQRAVQQRRPPPPSRSWTAPPPPPAAPPYRARQLAAAPSPATTTRRISLLISHVLQRARRRADTAPVRGCCHVAASCCRRCKTWPSVPARRRSSYSASSAGMARGSSSAASLPTLDDRSRPPTEAGQSPSTASASGPA